MKARLVLRESVDTLKEGYGFINQKDDCLKFANYRDLEVVKEHQLVESSSIWNRVRFQEIISEAIAQKSEIPVIVFPRVDRFARNLAAAGLYLGILRESGLTVMFALENLVVDNEASAINVLMFFIHSYKADQDGKQIRHNLLGGRDKLATEAREIPNGMVVFPFDYQAKRLFGKLNATGIPVINRERAAWVLEWTDWIIEEGMGLYEVCRKTNEAGILTRRGGKFSPKAVRDILRSRQLIGEFRWKGQLYLKDDNLRILTDRQFEALQKRLDENRERSYYNAAKLDYPPLRKMVIHDCGQQMYGVPLNNKPYYRCPKCRKSYIDAQVVWDEVKQGIKKALAREDWLIEQIKAQFDNTSRIEQIEQNIKVRSSEIHIQEDAKDQAFRMGMALSNYPIERVQAQIDKAEKNIRRLKQEKAELENTLRTLKEQVLDEEGLRKFCQLAKDNINKFSKHQWQLLNRLIKLRIIINSKTLIFVDAALPVMASRDTEIEFNRL